MSTREIATAAMCTRCGFWSRYRIAFDLIETSVAREIYTHPSLNGNMVEDYCPDCKRRLIQVDPLIVDLLAKLNQAGYITSNSCEGHWYMKTHLVATADGPILVEEPEIYFPYIKFDHRNGIAKSIRILDAYRTILKEHPVWNIVASIPLINRRGKEQVLYDWEYSQPWNTVVVGPASVELRPRKPKELKRIKSYRELNDDGRLLAMEQTQDFYQFIQELVNTLR